MEKNFHILKIFTWFIEATFAEIINTSHLLVFFGLKSNRERKKLGMKILHPFGCRFHPTLVV